MDRCPVCSGRLVMKPEGKLCMKSSCEGSKPRDQEEGVLCKCGQPMNYKGMDSWGQPSYACSACGATTKL